LLAKSTGITPFRPSDNKTIAAILLLPNLNTLVAPGLPDPWVLGSGKPAILQTMIALDRDPAK
jgi:hypothetical protein